MPQLATLIMNILAGSYRARDNKYQGTFFHGHALRKDDLELPSDKILLMSIQMKIKIKVSSRKG
jgi:hypothetical protein